MIRRLQHNERIMNPSHLLVGGGQRALDDILVRISYRDERPSVVEYASHGRAAYILERYSRENYIRDSVLFCMVERVKT